MRRTIARLAALAAAMLVLLAAAAPPASAAGAKSRDWRISYTDDLDFQGNIFAAFDAAPYFIFEETYETLTNSDAHGAFDFPDSLVTGFERAPDGKSYTFHLRPNLRWSDGQPLTADDVVFSWEQNSNGQVNGTYTDNFKAAVKVDSLTVKIVLTQPDARIPTAYVPIVPKHVWDKELGDKLMKYRPCCPMVGSGPYIPTKLDEKGTTVLERNPYFRGRKGPIDRILLIKYGDKEAELRDVKLNRLDAVLDADPKWVRDVRKDPQLKAWVGYNTGFHEIAFDMCGAEGQLQSQCTGPAPGVHVKVVQDRAIRQAIAWAIDRQTLLRTAYSNVGAVGNGIVSPFFAAKGYYEDWSKDPEVGYRYDPARARRVLRAGGWRCPAGGTCTKDGVQARFTLIARANSPEDQNAARRIIAYARNVGIRIDLEVITEDALNNLIYNTSPKDKNKYAPNYDAFMWDWFGDNFTPDYNFSVMTCDSSSTDSYWCNKQFGALTSKALSDLDFKQRVADLHSAEKIALEASAYIFTYHEKTVYVTRNDTWTGYFGVPSPDNAPFSETWQQLQDLKAGKAASTSYDGAPIALGVLGLLTLAAFATAAWRRRRENRGPYERVEGLPAD